MRFYHGKKEMLYVNRCSAPRCSALCFLTSFLPFNFLQSLLFGRQNGLIVSEKPLPGSQHKNHTIFMFGALVARCMGLRLRGCQSASLPLLRPKVRIPLRTCNWLRNLISCGKRFSNPSRQLCFFPRVLWFSPIGKVDRVGYNQDNQLKFRSWLKTVWTV